MLAEFGEKRVIDSNCRAWFYWNCSRFSDERRPIVEYMTFNFCLVGIDQIINNAAKMRQMTGGQFNVPIVFVVQQLRQDN
jgi:pyruvate dehydrogenase E1 component beta subunit